MDRSWPGTRDPGNPAVSRFPLLPGTPPSHSPQNPAQDAFEGLAPHASLPGHRRSMSRAREHSFYPGCRGLDSADHSPPILRRWLTSLAEAGRYPQKPSSNTTLSTTREAGRGGRNQRLRRLRPLDPGHGAARQEEGPAHRAPCPRRENTHSQGPERCAP